jgi:hypothetical protein
MSQRPTLSRGRGGMFGTGDTANDYGVNNKMPKTVGPDTSNFLDDNHDRLNLFSSGVTEMYGRAYLEL